MAVLSQPSKIEKAIFMNFETVKTIGPVMIIVLLAIPWFIGILFLLLSWFGGTSTGEVDLPQNEQCELIAKKQGTSI
jgi:hypothetical protein